MDVKWAANGCGSSALSERRKSTRIDSKSTCRHVAAHLALVEVVGKLEGQEEMEHYHNEGEKEKESEQGGHLDSVEL